MRRPERKPHRIGALGPEAVDGPSGTGAGGAACASDVIRASASASVCMKTGYPMGQNPHPRTFAPATPKAPASPPTHPTRAFLRESSEAYCTAPYNPAP